MQWTSPPKRSPWQNSPSACRIRTSSTISPADLYIIRQYFDTAFSNQTHQTEHPNKLHYLSLRCILKMRLSKFFKSLQYRLFLVFDFVDLHFGLTGLCFQPCKMVLKYQVHHGPRRSERTCKALVLLYGFGFARLSCSLVQQLPP